MHEVERLNITHRYNAEGPTMEARNADTTPEPLPTSRHTRGLDTAQGNDPG